MASASSSVNAQSTMTKGRRWLIFVVLMVAALTINCSQLKISALTTQVSDYLNVTATDTALLTSIFTIAAVILSIPGTFLMRTLGIRKIFMAMLVCLFVGNVIGVFADTFAMMMISRIIEGLSCSLVLPLGISLINMLFSGPETSTPSGIYSSATPIANFIIMNAALAIVNATGNLKAVWVVIAVLAIVSLVLVGIFVKDVDEQPEEAGTEKMSVGAQLAEAYRNPPLLLICIAMFFLSFVVQGLVTSYSSIFLSYGLSEATANWYSSLNGLFGIFIGILGGMFVAKVGKPYLTTIIFGVIAVFASWYVGHIVGNTYPLAVFLTAVTSGGVCMVGVFVIAPAMATNPSYVSLSSGLLNLSFYLGSLVSTPILTALSNNNASWSLPSYVMAASSILFIVFTVASMRAGGQKKLQGGE